MLVRDGASSEAIEVLMLRRSPKSTFVGGAYVFPGGAIDEADHDSHLWAVCEGRTDDEASRLLGVQAGGLAYWTAAIRECFEEAGVLLAVPHGRASAVARSGEYRNQLYTQGLGLAQLCQQEGLRLDVGSIHYFGHWITPVSEPRRYDTRFFVAATPPQQEPVHDDGETVASLWVEPAEALSRFDRGGFQLIYPTIKSLEAISRFRRTADLVAAAAQPLPVHDGQGVHIPLPAS
jgi:8-oxo-dGTP pyrophosphatase MutT (NUDIX family)